MQTNPPGCITMPEAAELIGSRAKLRWLIKSGKIAPGIKIKDRDPRTKFLMSHQVEQFVEKKPNIADYPIDTPLMANLLAVSPHHVGHRHMKGKGHTFGKAKRYTHVEALAAVIDHGKVTPAALAYFDRGDLVRIIKAHGKVSEEALAKLWNATPAQVYLASRGLPDPIEHGVYAVCPDAEFCEVLSSIEQGPRRAFHIDPDMWQDADPYGYAEWVSERQRLAEIWLQQEQARKQQRNEDDRYRAYQALWDAYNRPLAAKVLELRRADDRKAARPFEDAQVLTGQWENRLLWKAGRAPMTWADYTHVPTRQAILAGKLESSAPGFLPSLQRNSATAP